GITLSYREDFQELIMEDPPAEYGTQIPNETERKGLVTSRIGQGAYRKSVLHRWKFACAVTGYTKHEILIASHIVPWRLANNNERLDVHNGILLTPAYDALFDQHLISFENNGKIILSAPLKASDYHRIGISGREMIKNLSLENHDYLSRHRSELIF
ncbi:MAG: HNH endonuclease, partial [Sphingobacteriales bacterium]|nr:HNH endonuclease [Sphingobacteriales bacterium]